MVVCEIWLVDEVKEDEVEDAVEKAEPETEDKGRFGFSPGNVRTGRLTPRVAQASYNSSTVA